MAQRGKNTWRRKRQTPYRLQRSRFDESAFFLVILFAAGVWFLFPRALFRPPASPAPHLRPAPAAYVNVDFSRSSSRLSGGFIAPAASTLPSFPQRVRLEAPPLPPPAPVEAWLPPPPAPIASAPAPSYTPPLPRPPPEEPPAATSAPPRLRLTLSPELAAAGFTLPTDAFLALPTNRLSALPPVALTASVAMDAAGRPEGVLIDSADSQTTLLRWRPLLLAARSETNATGHLALEYR